MLLNKAERHATVDDALLDRVANDNHVLLDRRSRLLILQKLQLQKSGVCAFALGNIFVYYKLLLYILKINFGRRKKMCMTFIFSSELLLL